MISSRLENLVADFWDEAREKPPWPRDLEHCIACTHQVNVNPLPNLRVATVRQRLAQLPHSFGLDVRDRPLHGCLVAFRNGATIFVEVALPPADRRVVVAHEFGHFLADFLGPRRRATRRVGAQVLKIFDGDRPATTTERLEATLAGVELTAHVHYMERVAEGTFHPATTQVEQTANALALELLAPWREAVSHLRARGPWPAAPGAWETVLVEHFGLPPAWARPYAEQLRAAARSGRSFTETLGL